VTHPIGPMTAPEKAMPPLARLWKDESGQDLVEYALVAACVGLASVTGIHGIAAVISSSINVVVNRFTSIVSAAI
jgi:pilus assembly protein Flp/PilA